MMSSLIVSLIVMGISPCNVRQARAMNDETINHQVSVLVSSFVVYFRFNVRSIIFELTGQPIECEWSLFMIERTKNVNWVRPKHMKIPNRLGSRGSLFIRKAIEDYRC